ncbi:GH12 family glycosyl hydrolase domain-containing protein [Azospirillum sp. sgz302134]
MTTLSKNTDSFKSHGWVASSNVWNPGAYKNGKDFTQKIAIKDATFPNGTQITWSWPYDRHRALTYDNFPVRAYPELTYGVNPWSSAPSTTATLPARISSIKNLDIAYDFGITGDKNLYNVAFSLWISHDPAKGLQGVTDEVMVWVHNGYFTPAGHQIAKLQDPKLQDPKLQDPGGSATLWNQKNFDAEVKTNPVKWEYTALKYDKDQLSGTLDVDALMKTLVDRGTLSKDDWLLGVQVGAEVAAGHGTLDVKHLAVNFVGPSPKPSAPLTTAAALALPPPSGAPTALAANPDPGIAAPPRLS